MKTLKFKIFTLILIAGFSANAQFGGVCPPDTLKERFLNTKTLILKTGNEHFDENLAAGFKENWTLTTYEFVATQDEINVEDRSISYLVPIAMTIGNNYLIQYNRYALIFGGTEKLTYRIAADIRCDKFGYEEEVVESAYRAYGFAKIMQDFIQMKIDGEPMGGNTLTKVRYTTGNVYNRKSTKIKSKILLIDDRALDPGPYSPSSSRSFDKEKFEKLYEGKVKFVSSDELEKAINDNDPDYTYLTLINSLKRYIMVMDCESGEVWYNGYEPNSTSVGLSIKDVKRLSKSVNGKEFISAQ